MGKKRAEKKDTYEHIEEEEEILESYLSQLGKTNGFKAAGIMTHSGEILAGESNDPNIDLYRVGTTFNNIFRTAHEASEKIGLESCLELSIKTPKGIIIMRCSGVNAPIHFHLIAILSSMGNQALAKLELEKLIPQIMASLT
ncbi:MAG: hypothetical protein KJ950_14955 [Proteobacteria bacterium]|nr:hypothetical protein [Pseudomonadota bacterium]MBU1688634.1 hypothetical protein [Pseudomonadota bacterium]